MAASALKHTIPGDFNLVSESEATPALVDGHFFVIENTAIYCGVMAFAAGILRLRYVVFATALLD